MTQCTQTEIEFDAHFSRAVVVRFDGGTMTSDAGALLLRRTDRLLNLLPRLAVCFCDERDTRYIAHSLPELLAQRVYGLALGYEDLSDHEQLRQDPLLAVLSGKPQAGEEALAGKSTLNRLELSTGTANRYKKIHCQTEAVDQLLVNVFLEAHAVAPERIVLDLDVTDLPLHGHQQGRFFPRLLRSLLLFAVVHLLRRASAVRPPAHRRSGCGGWQQGRGGAHCLSNPASVAGGGDHLAGRLRFLPRRADEVVRRAGYRLRLWLCPQRALTAAHKSSDGASPATVSGGRKTGPCVYRVLLRNYHRQLEPGPKSDCEIRVFGQGREPALCRHELERGDLAGATALRRTLLCARRDGKSKSTIKIATERYERVACFSRQSSHGSIAN